MKNAKNSVFRASRFKILLGDMLPDPIALCAFSDRRSCLVYAKTLSTALGRDREK